MPIRKWRVECGEEQSRSKLQGFKRPPFQKPLISFCYISSNKVWTADAVGKDKALRDLAKNIQIKPDLFAQTKKQTRHELAECESLIYFTF